MWYATFLNAIDMALLSSVLEIINLRILFGKIIFGHEVIFKFLSGASNIHSIAQGGPVPWK